MYSYEIQPSLEKKFKRILKKNKKLYIQILKKIEEIITSDKIDHYKNLRQDMKDKKRIHIGSFVLIFKFIEDKNKIIFVDFDCL